MPAMLNEFELFRLYSKEVKNFLKENLYLSRYPIDENVTVEYATPPRAFVKFLVPVINGGNLNPTVTFYLESMEYLDGENLLGFVRQYRLNGDRYEHVSAPLIYKLNYKAVIMVATPSDGDILQFQLLAAGRKNKKHWSKVDGQWTEIVSGNPVDETSPEPGEADKVYKRSVSVSIPRAYLPMEYVNYGIIEQINVKLEMLESLVGISNDTIGMNIDNIPDIGLAGHLHVVSTSNGSLNKELNLDGNINAISNVNG
jgi:hypothetical protein